MKFLSVSLLVVVAGATGITGHGGPVNKVYKLLEDLEAKIEVEGETDAKSFEDHQCWCDRVKEEKTRIIAEEDASITKLENEIKEGEATAEILSEKIEDDTEGIQQNTLSEKKGAATASKSHEESLRLSGENGAKLNAIDSARQQLASTTNGPLSFLQEQSMGKKYTPAGAEVDGILKSQYEITDQDEKENKETDKKTMEAFRAWDADMLKTIRLLEEDKAKEEKSEAETKVEIAEDLEMKDNTVAQRKSDKAFLAEAEQSCLNYSEEYNDREKLRRDEVAGIQTAKDILDSKRELLRSTFKDVKGSSFLQLGSEQSSASALAVSLKQLAKTSHSFRLASVAASLQEALPDGAFDTVIEKITGMQEKIKLEALTDTEKKDYCKAEYATIARKSNKLTFLIEKKDAEIDKLENRIEALIDDKANANKKIAAIDADLKDALELRTKENDNFKNESADDKEAIAILKATNDALHEYYEKNTGGAHAPSFLQLATDPEGLSDRVRKIRDSEDKKSLTRKDSQRQAAAQIFAQIDRISENLEKEIATGKEDEAEAQLAYEKSRDLLQASREKLTKHVTDIERDLSNHDATKKDEEEAKGNGESDLAAQKEYRKSIQQECDWLLENFDARVQKREDEKASLTRAKALLSGAAFVQQKEIRSHDIAPVYEEKQVQSTDLEAPSVPNVVQTVPEVHQATPTEQQSSLLAYLRR
eukprot:TRINITY_DN4474_c0_g2_i1.p1 TRINITY_DN4474_c0_g2~~TRINITY_DN4474_c0_g2_i1.p1  ORF type:complete len:705 (-),score=231.46 TRINITY_DN4474_c0_g2_i1:174-2288(-)